MAEARLKYGWLMVACSALATALLLAGYLLKGWWLILLIFPMALLLWWGARSKSGLNLPSVLFGGYLFLASLGIWLGQNPYWMVYGSILALAGWELQMFHLGLAGDIHHSGVVLLERQHLKLLSAVIILSLLATTLALNLQFRLPFGVTVLLVLLVGLILERVHHVFGQERSGR